MRRAGQKKICIHKAISWIPTTYSLWQMSQRSVTHQCHVKRIYNNMERLLGLGYCWPNHAFFLLFLFQHRKTQNSSDVTVKKLDKTHLHEHEIQTLCLRLKITQGNKKQQLSQPFHAKIHTNLGSKEKLEKKMNSANLNPELYSRKFYFELRDRLGSEKGIEIWTREIGTEEKYSSTWR